MTAAAPREPLAAGSRRVGATGRAVLAGAAAASLLLHLGALGALLAWPDRVPPPPAAAEQGVQMLWQPVAEARLAIEAGGDAAKQPPPEVEARTDPSEPAAEEAAAAQPEADAGLAEPRLPLPPPPLPPPQLPPPLQPRTAARAEARPSRPAAAQDAPAPAETPLYLGAAAFRAPGGGASRAEGAVTAPSQLPGFRNPEPDYPETSRARGEEGTVRVLLRIAPSGEVAGVEILASSGHRRLDAAARAAALRWRFTPARRDGVPVAGTIRTAITFRLER